MPEANRDTPQPAIEVFYSYAHEDEKLRDELEKHLSILKRQGVIRNWHDRKITAGDEWKGAIDEHLETADIILLLVSVDFLASDYCYDVEVRRAMERHDAKEARVIPVILRPCNWKGAPFEKLHALPKDAKPVTSWTDWDEAFKDVAEGIRKAIENGPRNPPPKCGHEIPDDDYYVGRKEDIDRLTDWAKDPNVRMFAITGLGGQGKTSLVNHWLRTSGVQRGKDGVFYWSFYADRDIDAFLRALRQCGIEHLNFKASIGEQPLEYLERLLQQKSLLIAMDGLEAFQEGRGSSTYGTLNNSTILKTLEMACSIPHKSLVILTSRIPFTDLHCYQAKEFWHLNLEHLSVQEGAELLAKYGIRGDSSDRENVSRRFDSHPLSLRIFAAVSAAEGDGDPTRLYKTIFNGTGLQEDDPLEKKLLRLLEFYHQRLPPRQAALLEIFSLFSSPLKEAEVKNLVDKLGSVLPALANLSEEALPRELNKLSNDHLLIRANSDGDSIYSCHPVLSDYFYRILLDQGESDKRRSAWVFKNLARILPYPGHRHRVVGKIADRIAKYLAPLLTYAEHHNTVAHHIADILTEKPFAGQFPDIRDYQRVLKAIEVLLDTGNFERANRLFIERLNYGEIFFSFPAHKEGLECSRGFIADMDRRRQCHLQLFKSGLGFYLNHAALNATMAGELSQAVSFFKEAIACGEDIEDSTLLSFALQFYSDIQGLLGFLEDAEANIKKALELKDNAGSEQQIYALCSIGDLLMQQGRIAEALQRFKEAQRILAEYPKRNESEISCLVGRRWSSLMLKLGQARDVIQQTQSDLQVCKEKRWHGSAARCHWLLGRAYVEERDYEQAEFHLKEAEGIVERGHMLIDKPRLLLARADLARRREEWDAASHYVDKAIEAASSRKMFLDKADALVLQGRIRLGAAFF